MRKCCRTSFRLCQPNGKHTKHCSRSAATFGGSRATETPRQQTGSATAGEFAPVLDSENRPITAGGFVKTGPVIFQDISEKSGLTTWQHKMGTPQKTYILETIGSGVALLDYDNDGWLDIYMVNGSTYEAYGKDDATACRAVPQQSRRHIYRCSREGRHNQRSLGLRRGRGRL